MKNRHLILPIVLCAAGILLILLNGQGCSKSSRRPAEDPSIVRTPVGKVRIINPHLTTPNDLVRVDNMWAGSQNCYGIILDGALLSIEVREGRGSWYSEVHGFWVDGWYERGRKTIVVSQDLNAVPHEMAHHMECELGLTHAGEDWDVMHDRMDARAASCGTAGWNSKACVRAPKR